MRKNSSLLAFVWLVGTLFGTQLHETEDLRVLAARSKDEPGDVVVYVGLPQADVMGQSSLPGEDSWTADVRAKTCAADAVVLVRVNDQHSGLSEDGRLIVTEFGMAVEQVLKQDGERALNEMDSIAVLRTGGSVRLNAKNVVMVQVGARAFTKGSQYLLFLTRSAGPKAYEAHVRSAYEMDGGELSPLVGAGGAVAQDRVTQVVIRQACGGSAGTVEHWIVRLLRRG